ncbi:MAG TPA: DUF1552 domain-containing protein [Sorangium sp.]|nr:DUF1552 domain-containing protein [Sorangium sp.]
MNRRTQFGASRRRMLQALGLGAGAAAMGPLLPLMNASGQENVRPKRLLIIFQPDGAPARDWNNVIDWRPQGSERSFSLHAIHAPLEPWKSKLVIPWGLKMTAGGAGEAHAFGMAGLWTASTLNGPSSGANFDGGNGNRTGWGSGASIDQIIAGAHGSGMPYERAPDDPVQETPYRTVELGVQCLNPNSLNRMIYAGENSPIHPETNPRAAFNRLFAGVTPTGEAPTTDQGAEQERTERKAIVDLLKNDLTRIRRRVGKEDYNKLDAHLEGLLAMERRLNQAAEPADPALSCEVPEEPAETRGRGSEYPTEIRSMMDIAVAAFSCDVTRVMSLQLSYAFSHILHAWLGHTSDHHTMSHDGQDRRRELQEIDAWYSEQIAYLLGRLDSVSEGDGTLLDNTLVVVGRELGSTAHRMERVPFVMAGGARGALKGGRYLAHDGEDHAKLLVSIAQLMGLETNSIGNRKRDSGPLSGLI